jgi:hypothetical protein
MNEGTKELDVNAAEPVHREAEDALWLPARRPIPVLPAGQAENSFWFFCVPRHGVTSLTLAKRFRPHHGNAARVAACTGQDGGCAIAWRMSAR